MFAPVRKKRLQTDSTSSGEAITKPNEDSDNEGVWLKDEPKKMVSSEMDSSSDSDSSSSSTSSCSSSSHIDVLTNVENTAIESSDNRSGSIYNLDDVEEFDSGTESEIDTSQNDMVLSISIPRSIEGLTIPISKATPTPPPTNKESSGSPPTQLTPPLQVTPPTQLAPPIQVIPQMTAPLLQATPPTQLAPPMQMTSPSQQVLAPPMHTTQSSQQLVPPMQATPPSQHLAPPMQVTPPSQQLAAPMQVTPPTTNPMLMPLVPNASHVAMTTTAGAPPPYISPLLSHLYHHHQLPSPRRAVTPDPMSYSDHVTTPIATPPLTSSNSQPSLSQSYLLQYMQLIQRQNMIMAAAGNTLPYLPSYGYCHPSQLAPPLRSLGPTSYPWQQNMFLGGGATPPQLPVTSTANSQPTTTTT